MADLSKLELSEIAPAVRKRTCGGWPKGWAATFVDRLQSLRGRRRDDMNQLRDLLYELESQLTAGQVVTAERAFLGSAIELVEWHLAGRDDTDPERCLF